MRHLDGNTSLLHVPSESADDVEGDESTLSEPGRIGVNNISVYLPGYSDIDQHKIRVRGHCI